MAPRLAALLVALAVSTSGSSPCTAAALARASAAAEHASQHAAAAEHASQHAAAAHAAHAGADEGRCHDPTTTISARCPCGCTGDLPRAAASTASVAWALPAPLLPRMGSAAAAAPQGRLVRPAERVPPGIDHVPIVA